MMGLKLAFGDCMIGPLIKQGLGLRWLNASWLLSVAFQVPDHHRQMARCVRQADAGMSRCFRNGAREFVARMFKCDRDLRRKTILFLTQVQSPFRQLDSLFCFGNCRRLAGRLIALLSRYIVSRLGELLLREPSLMLPVSWHRRGKMFFGSVHG